MGHEPRLEADLGRSHLALDLGLRDQGRHRVDDDDVHGMGPGEFVNDLKRLLSCFCLDDDQLLDWGQEGRAGSVRSVAVEKGARALVRASVRVRENLLSTPTFCE